MKFRLISLIIFILFCSCKKEKIVTVSLKNYKKFEVKEDRLSILLIKSFPNNISCNGKIKNANLYLCEVTETGDTILVFEPCLEMPDFAKNNFSGERDLVINSKDIIKDSIDEVAIVIEDTPVFINKRYKYILGSITYLIY